MGNIRKDEGEKIWGRVIDHEKPEGIVQEVMPTLEDVYLYTFEERCVRAEGGCVRILISELRKTLTLRFFLITQEMLAYQEVYESGAYLRYTDNLYSERYLVKALLYIQPSYDISDGVLKAQNSTVTDDPVPLHGNGGDGA